MDSYQGLTGRKLLPDIGQAVAMAAASSSSPSPFPHADGTYLTSPFERNPQLKPIMVIIIAFVIVAFFLIGFLSAHFQNCYTHAAGLRTTLYNHQLGLMQGLDASILETLPKVMFSSATAVQLQKKEKQQTTTECVICLEEFQDQELLRLLPPCGHAFHLECINMWFFSHTTCPLCRRSLLLHPNTNTIAIALASPNSVSIATNSVAMETVQIRAPENPKSPSNPSEEGESSANHAQLRRSHSMGHSLLPPPSLHSSSFIVHRSSSCTVLLDLAMISEGA